MNTSSSSLHRHRLTHLPFAILALTFAQAAAQESIPDEAKHTESLRKMQQIAEQITILRDDQELERIEHPLFRFTDPARGFLDGSAWGWGKQGRPRALVVMADDDNLSWLVETVALSDAHITNVDAAAGLRWTSRGGPKMITLSATAPGNSTTLQKLQLKQIARRFTAHEMWDNDGQTEMQRYQLRLIPKPIHVYSDSKNGIAAGGLFLFSYGANPEIVMILEAAENDQGSLQWRCGFGRISWSQLNVKFDDKDVWQQPKIRGPTENYVLRRIRSLD